MVTNYDTYLYFVRIDLIFSTSLSNIEPNQGIEQIDVDTSGAHIVNDDEAMSPSEDGGKSVGLVLGDRIQVEDDKLHGFG